MLIKIPGYSDIFEGPLPKYKDLVEDIPSEVIIKLLCYMNHQLYLDPYSNHVQILLFKAFFERISDSTKQRLATQLQSANKDNKGRHILFASQFILTMLERELVANRQLDFEDTNAEQEHRIFQAYLLIVQEITERPFEEEITFSSKKEYFYKNIWRIQVNQIDFSRVANPRHSLLMSILFLDFLSTNPRVKDSVQNFLDQFVTRGYLDYIMRYLSILHALAPSNPDDMNRNVVIRKAEGYEHILDWLSIDIDKLGSNPKLREDFIGLRAKPLIKFQDEYFITHRKYLVEKLFLSLQFDLFHFQDFREKFSGFQDFRSFVGLNFTERYLVKTIFENCLVQNKHQVLLFDDEEQYMPDAYFRNGKNIFLFELKDTLMSAKVIESFSFEAIRDDLEMKFVANRKGAPKGISQIKMQIDCLEKSVFVRDDFLDKGLKRRNMRVFPIILYTDSRYGVSGVEEYLNDRFLDIREESKVFQRIERLAFIDFRWFIDSFIKLRNGQVDLKTALVQHRKAIDSRKRKASLTNKIEDFEKTFANFGGIGKSTTRPLNEDRLSQILKILGG